MTFKEKNHIYLSEEGNIYTSGTSFIKNFCKPFDRIKIATKYAKKNKRTIEDVLEEWDKAGADAIEKGIIYHKMKEDELLSKSDMIIENEVHFIYPPKFVDGNKTNNSLKLEPGVYPELIIWSDRYSIAGQADYVEITKGGKINIKDYKTSKEIKLESYMDWKGQYQMMTFPFNNFQDCNFNHYCLQLNLYAYLIKSHNRNLEIGSLKIEHVVGDFDKETKTFKIETINQYTVPNLQDEIRVGLEYWKNKNI